jgi:hypothetical protein
VRSSAEAELAQVESSLIDSALVVRANLASCRANGQIHNHGKKRLLALRTKYLARES